MLVFVARCSGAEHCGRCRRYRLWPSKHGMPVMLPLQLTTHWAHLFGLQTTRPSHLLLVSEFTGALAPLPPPASRRRAPPGLYQPALTLSHCTIQ